MTKKVKVSRRAARDIERITDYLLSEWDLKVVNDFIIRYHECFDLIAKNPELYPFAGKGKQVRRCVLTKHSIIYFKEFSNKISILTVFDTRQNPKKLNKII